MNVMQLNTDIYNSLGVLSNDESYLEEALASINQAFTEYNHADSMVTFSPAFFISAKVLVVIFFLSVDKYPIFYFDLFIVLR